MLFDDRSLSEFLAAGNQIVNWMVFLFSLESDGQPLLAYAMSLRNLWVECASFITGSDLI